MSIVDNIREAVSLVQKMGNIFKQNRKLRQRVSELEELIAKGAEVRFENGAYYRNREDGSREGPICSRCLDVTDKQVMLHSLYNQNVKATIFRCPECGTRGLTK